MGGLFSVIVFTFALSVIVFSVFLLYLYKTFPAEMSDEDMASQKAWFGVNAKDVLRR